MYHDTNQSTAIATELADNNGLALVDRFAVPAKPTTLDDAVRALAKHLPPQVAVVRAYTSMILGFVPQLAGNPRLVFTTLLGICDQYGVLQYVGMEVLAASSGMSKKPAIVAVEVLTATGVITYTKQYHAPAIVQLHEHVVWELAQKHVGGYDALVSIIRDFEASQKVKSTKVHFDTLTFEPEVKVEDRHFDCENGEVKGSIVHFHSDEPKVKVSDRHFDLATGEVKVEDRHFDYGELGASVAQILLDASAKNGHARVLGVGDSLEEPGNSNEDDKKRKYYAKIRAEAKEAEQVWKALNAHVSSLIEANVVSLPAADDHAGEIETEPCSHRAREADLRRHIASQPSRIFAANCAVVWLDPSEPDLVKASIHILDHMVVHRAIYGHDRWSDLDFGEDEDIIEWTRQVVRQEVESGATGDLRDALAEYVPNFRTWVKDRRDESDAEHRARCEARGSLYDPATGKLIYSSDDYEISRDLLRSFVALALHNKRPLPDGLPGWAFEEEVAA